MFDHYMKIAVKAEEVQKRAAEHKSVTAVEAIPLLYLDMHRCPSCKMVTIVRGPTLHPHLVTFERPHGQNGAAHAKHSSESRIS